MKKCWIFVISGPSGVGKTVLCKKLVEKYPDKLVYSISLTSRPPREGEKNGEEYLFISREEFEQLIKEEAFLEWSYVYGHYYGTLKKNMEEAFKAGKSLLLNVDIKGAFKIKSQNLPAISIFIAPPNLKTLEERLRKRHSDKEQDIKLRLQEAEWELKNKEHYDYVVVNDILNEAFNKLCNIMEKYI